MVSSRLLFCHFWPMCYLDYEMTVHNCWPMWQPGQRVEKYLVLDFLIRWSLLSTQEYASFIVYQYERYETGTMFRNFMNIYLFIFKTAVHSVMVSDYPIFGWTVSCNTDMLAVIVYVYNFYAGELARFYPLCIQPLILWTVPVATCTWGLSCFMHSYLAQVHMLQSLQQFLMFFSEVDLCGLIFVGSPSHTHARCDKVLT